MSRVLTIETGQTEGPREYAWWACFGEYDGGDNNGNGTTCGHGPSEELAVIDLITNYDWPSDG